MLLGMRVSILAALKVPRGGWVPCADSRVGNVRRSSGREGGACPGIPWGWASEGHDPFRRPSPGIPRVPRGLCSRGTLPPAPSTSLPPPPQHTPVRLLRPQGLCTHSPSRQPLGLCSLHLVLSESPGSDPSPTHAPPLDIA